MEIRLHLNEREVSFYIRPNETLIELIRNRVGALGTVEGCGVGVCGSCTVLMDGEPVSSCITLAANAHGTKVVTIEGLSHDGEMHDVQRAFMRQSAFQCGYCTPGMIMGVCGLLSEYRNPTVDQIRDYLSGNLCRCGTYGEIIDAVRATAQARISVADDLTKRASGRARASGIDYEE